jgi:hypothetical protein
VSLRSRVGRLERRFPPDRTDGDDGPDAELTGWAAALGRERFRRETAEMGWPPEHIEETERADAVASPDWPESARSRWRSEGQAGEPRS